MEQNLNAEPEITATTQPEETRSTFSFANIYTAVILNWKWFVLSLIICIGLAAVYLRYTTPIYQASAKLLIKDNDQNGGGRSANMLNSATLGMISNSNGFDNELEILTSHSLAQQAVRDLKLYVNYYHVGKVKDVLMYKTQPINVDVDPSHLERLNAPVDLKIERTGNSYHVTGTYYVPVNDDQADGPFSIDKTFSQLPATIGTRAGIISFNANTVVPMKDGDVMKVNIQSPKFAAYKYVGELNVSQTSKTTTIAQLTLSDENPQRAIDYLQQLSICYNRQANEDKNEVAERTEEFINGRLEKINAELGNTEGQLESYKKRNGMIDLKANATSAFSNADQYSQKLSEANTQVALLDEMQNYMDNPNNRFQPLPSNVGLNDDAATSLISNYNQLVQRRNLLLQSASENSPSVMPLTTQIEDMDRAIRRALKQARRNLDIQRNSVASQYGKYQGQVGESPEQERMLTQIGRQQEVKSGLYLMLLQKREENSISLAATADKGKLIDGPALGGKVSPKSSMILLAALIIALGLPAIIIFLLEFFRYKIEGHEDVAKLTTLPIIADVAVSTESAKTKGEIVIHENRNNQMEEIFRSMRTNLQFVLEKDEKVVMFTSSISGEGKTFITSNLAVSFALLGKKVLLVGLDIRKPRLADLFEIDDHQHGITNLLVKNTPTWEDIQQQLVPSGINNNLTLLMAGPTPPNPSELVSRKSLDDIFAELRKHYDYILVDRADFTPKESIVMINSLHNQKKLPKINIVINGIDMSKKKYGYYYGYGRYGKYGRYARYTYYRQHGSYSSYGSYGYGGYGGYGNYQNSRYGDKNDTSIKQ